MVIAVHRWGGGDVKKRYVCLTDKQSLPIDCIYAYIPYLSPKFHLTPFAPTL